MTPGIDNEIPRARTLLRHVRAAAESGIAPLANLRPVILSAEQVGELNALPELARILCAPHVNVGMTLLHASGLMSSLLPEVEMIRSMPVRGTRHKDVYRHTLLVVQQTPPEPLVRLAALLHDIGKPQTKTETNGGVHFPGHAEVGAELARRCLHRLGADDDTVRAVTLLVALHLRANSYEADWTDSAVRRLDRDADDQLERLLALSRADVTSARPQAVERALRRVDALEQRIQAVRHADVRVESPIDGTALMAMFGRPPGQWIGAVKDHLTALVESGLLDPADSTAATRIAHEIVAAFDAGATVNPRKRHRSTTLDE